MMDEDGMHFRFFRAVMNADTEGAGGGSTTSAATTDGGSTATTETTTTTTEEKPAGEAAASTAAPAGSLLGRAAAAAKSGDGTTEAKPEGEAKDGEAKDGENAEGEAPAFTAEDIQVEVPEGFTYDEKLGGEFKGVLADPTLKLSKDQANALAGKMAGLHVKAIQAQHEAWAGVQAGWVKATNEDAEIGGNNHTTAMTSAVKALDTFGTPELVKLLDEYGIGNNPEIIRFFSRVGKATGEDSIVQAGGGGAKSAAEVLYGNN